MNEPPYGTERCYNALLKNDLAAEIAIFLMADAVSAAKADQKTPDGYYNIERMLKRVLAAKGQILLCGTCMDVRRLNCTHILAGAAAQQHGRTRRSHDGNREGAGILGRCGAAIQCQNYFIQREEKNPAISASRYDGQAHCAPPGLIYRVYAFMFCVMLKRATTYFLVFAVILGVTLQIAGSAFAAARQPAMPAAMDMGGDCDQPAPPCKGMTQDCIDSMGCLVSSAVPVAPLAALVPFQWGAVSYFSLNAMPTGVSIKPEHSPPIPHA